MNKLLLLLFAVLSFTACKKNAIVDPQPTTSLADKFAGTYALSSFRYTDTDSQVNVDLPTLPMTNNGNTVSGTVSLVKKTDTTVDMRFLMKATGATDFKLDLPDLEVRKVGSEYGLFSDDTRIADVEGTIIIFNYSETDQQTKGKTEMAYIAKR